MTWGNKFELIFWAFAGACGRLEKICPVTIVDIGVIGSIFAVELELKSFLVSFERA
jgi:hypothetical protein